MGLMKFITLLIFLLTVIKVTVGSQKKKNHIREGGEENSIQKNNEKSRIKEIKGKINIQKINMRKKEHLDKSEINLLNVNKTNNENFTNINSAILDFLALEDDDHLFTVKNIKCSRQVCPPPSFCLDESTCKCGEGRANVYIPDHPFHNDQFCEYRQKQQVVAFLLEVFISAGMGHLYAGRTTCGVIKFLVFVLPCLFIGCSTCIKSTQGSEFCFLLSIVLTCSYIIWQIVDIINFATNSYKDGYDVPFLHW